MGPRALQFLLQIDLAELGGFDFLGALPKAGVLSFFYDVDEQPWGYDPADQAGSRVVFSESAGLVQTLPPRRSPLETRSIQFWPSISVPHFGSRAYSALEAEVALPDSYLEFGSELERHGYPENAGLHRVLGHSANVQGDMQLEAEFVAHGIDAAEPSGYDPARARALEVGADGWMLLLQLDSDESVHMSWGDGGMLYFWIRRADLLKRRFDRCWVRLQCT